MSADDQMFLVCTSIYMFMFLLSFKLPKVQEETNHLPSVSVLFAKNSLGVDAFLNFIKGLV